MTLTLSGDALADKYETKRDGLTCDEALEASVIGYRIRCPSLQAGAYIHYVFDGWRIQFVHDGREGSSSGWTPDRQHWLEAWSIVPLPSEVARDAWGKPIQQPGSVAFDAIGDRGYPRSRDSWGRPVV